MVGENIQRLREIRGLTQEDIAKSLSMSLSAYGKIERGETGLSFEKAKAIAKLLQVSIGELDEFDEKRSVHIYHHNTLHNCQQGETYIYSGLAENERKLYEDKIKLLEEMLRMKDEQLANPKK